MKEKSKKNEALADNEIVKESHGLYYTKKEPRKSLSTFLRNQNKLYVNYFNMIDRKAAIMIRVNSTIISAIVIFSQYINSIKFGLFIGITMVICSFISLMFAINASRPHIFAFIRRRKNKVLNQYSSLESTLFSIGNNGNVSLEEYEQAFDKITKNQELQVGNQVRTMYIFENQIKNSFSHIEFAYFSFMIGFSIAVIAFIIGSVLHLF